MHPVGLATTLSGDNGYRELTGLLNAGVGPATATFHGLTLASAFQPLFSLTHRRAVGYEGLLRATRKDTHISPVRVFASVENEREAVRLDRLCRLLHLTNFVPQNQQDRWLFLNVNATAVASERQYSSFFTDALRAAGLAPARVVIEILESAVHDRGRLADLIAFYRTAGCLIAIDDFGAGHSNFDRVGSLAPDFVKIDRSILVSAARDPKVRRTLPGLVSLLHEAGALVVLEGIESTEEALIAADSDVDFVQGYLFGRPRADLETESSQQLLNTLCTDFRGFLGREALRTQQHLSGVATQFVFALQALEHQTEATVALAPLLHHPYVLRCYLLDAEGNQIGANYLSVMQTLKQDTRFAPLANVASANWSRRPYFRRAMTHPGALQVTRPYFSVTDARLVVTLSQTCRVSNRSTVLCCDVEPVDL